MFPTRPNLSAFGPKMEDTRPVEKPTKDLAASVWNQMRAAVPGLSAVSPLAILHFTSAASPLIVARAEVWNPDGGTTGAHADPLVTRHAAGDYTWAWTSPTEDVHGESVPVIFTYAAGIVVDVDTPALTPFRVRCAVVAANRNRIRVRRISGADALAEAGEIFIWAW